VPSWWTNERVELGVALATDPATSSADFTVAPSPDGIKALPALIVGPGANWVDGSYESGPGRMVRYELAVDLVVNAQEPVGAMVDLEDGLDRVLARLPNHWRLERAEPPRRETARSGELVTLTARVTLSRKHSIEGG
jgi:hypothetical protein